MELLLLKIWFTTMFALVSLFFFSWIKMNSEKPTKIDWFKVAKISGIVLIAFLVIPMLIGIWLFKM